MIFKNITTQNVADNLSDVYIEYYYSSQEKGVDPIGIEEFFQVMNREKFFIYVENKTDFSYTDELEEIFKEKDFVSYNETHNRYVRLDFSDDDIEIIELAKEYFDLYKNYKESKYN